MCGEPRSKNALIQKRPEIKLKKPVFLNESKEQHWNLKRTKITSYMKGAFPPQRPALYAKVYYCFKNKVKRKNQTLA